MAETGVCTLREKTHSQRSRFKSFKLKIRIMPLLISDRDRNVLRLKLLSFACLQHLFSLPTSSTILNSILLPFENIYIKIAFVSKSRIPLVRMINFFILKLSILKFCLSISSNFNHLLQLSNNVKCMDSP